MPVDVGQLAPDFTLKDQHNQQTTLSAFRGEKNVLLLFYPWAFTRVCRGELQEIQAQLDNFQNDDVQVLTVSTDTVVSLRVWADREGFEFPLLSDFWPHGAVASAYGVFDETRGCARRGTYLVDRSGVVRWKVENEIPDARETADYLKALADL